ncbi:MAG: aminotransferase class I/II-fold pyridoxal phosphate-dependent enzyme [Mucilaginibacter sp.]
MNSAEDLIKKKLDERKGNGTYRSLKIEGDLIDFCSNDYLGFARSARLKEMIQNEFKANEKVLNGSTGSRLLSGNTIYVEELERSIANFHKAEAGLIYNSGYDANIGLFSSLPQKGDTIILDELSHASIIDGARLSFANRFTFKHNDLQSLEEKLQHAKGNIYVVIESVYSMDGDSPDIDKLIGVVNKYNAQAIVDEAHATGLYYNGIVNSLNLEDKVFARVVTFGKALGCHGAIILGSRLLREYLINFSRSFIYTTAAPFHQLASIKMSYELLFNSTDTIQKLRDNITLFKEKIGQLQAYKLLPSDSAIQCLVIDGNEKTRQLSENLLSAGFDIRPILSPTVPAGTERLRICLHAYNTAKEITSLTETINELTHD